MAGVKGQSGGGGKRKGAGRKPSEKTIFLRNFIGPVIPRKTRRIFASDEDRKAAIKDKNRKKSIAKSVKLENKRREECECAGVEYGKYKRITNHELVCAECGVVFIGKLINAKYCSASCRVKAANDKQSNKAKHDDVLRLKLNTRSRISLCFRQKGYTKISKTHEILGCDWEFFKHHIEKQFTKGMTWGKIGSEIHIDHITPLATAKTEADVIALNHFTNLRPLWAADNLAKSDIIQYLI